MGLTKNKLIIGFPVNEEYAKRIDRKTCKALRVFLTDGQDDLYIINEIPRSSQTIFTAKTVKGEEVILNTAWIIKAIPVIYDVFRFDVTNHDYSNHTCKPDNNQIAVYEFACVYTEAAEVEIIDEYITDGKNGFGKTEGKNGFGKIVNRQIYCEDINNLKALTY